MLKIEESDGELASDSVEVSGFERNVLNYHMRLMSEAGFVDGIDATSSSGYALLNVRLTWSGHDFLDSVRDDSIWESVQKRLIPVGGAATLETVKALAVELTKTAIGIE